MTHVDATVRGHAVGRKRGPWLALRAVCLSAGGVRSALLAGPLESDP
jgi:hypothetical protein